MAPGLWWWQLSWQHEMCRTLSHAARRTIDGSLWVAAIAEAPELQDMEESVHCPVRPILVLGLWQKLPGSPTGPRTGCGLSVNHTDHVPMLCSVSSSNRGGGGADFEWVPPLEQSNLWAPGRSTMDRNWEQWGIWNQSHWTMAVMRVMGFCACLFLTKWRPYQGIWHWSHSTLGLSLSGATLGLLSLSHSALLGSIASF